MEVPSRLCYFHQEIIYLDYLCIIGINLGKNKSKSASHDKVTMYRLSYVNSHIILKNICKFQLIIAQITIGSLPPSPRNWSFVVGMFGYFPFGSLVTICIW